MKTLKPTLFENRNFTSLLIIFIAFIMAVPAQAQERNLDREILVYILPDSLELPAEEKGRVGLQRAEIASENLFNTFQKLSVSEIERAFPLWNKADSVRVLESGRVVHRPRFHRVHIIHLPAGASADKFIEQLEREPSVAYAEKHINGQLENDTYYADQWYLNNTGQAGGTAGADIQAEDAWSIFTGSSSIKIGIFDTGVDLNHIDLNGKASGDYHHSGISTDPSSQNHGTHVAGIAAGKANNQNGLIRGVDWNAQIVSKKVSKGDGSDESWMGNNNFANKVVDAVDNDNVDVLNHSWGSLDQSPTVGSAMAYAYEMNRVSVVSAGNQDGNLTFPASMGHGVLSVGATQNDDTRASFSSYGNTLNVTAPGGTNLSGPYNNEDILSAEIGDDVVYNAGTSMAAPVVSGIASLLKGYDNDLYNDDIQRIIELSADEVGNDPYNSDGWNQFMGYGRVNAYEALKMLQEPYELNHHTASGGTVHSTTTGWMMFYGLPGYAGGAYSVKEYDVRKTINFSWMDEPNVWGRGVESIGYSRESPNFTMGFTDVVSSTNDSAVLRTYVYEIWTTAGQYMGWFPTKPENVEFAYTVHGIPGTPPPPPPPSPTVSISGPSNMFEGSTDTFTANVSGGSPPYSYQWYYRHENDCCWTSTGTNSPTYDHTAGAPNGEYVRVVVQDQYPYTVEDQHYFTILGWSMQVEAPSLPEEFSLTQNYPNPFNPSSTIRYELPERAEVSLAVYNMLGQRVAMLIDREIQPGRHEAVFDASALSSGNYIARFTATGTSGEQFVQSLNMQLVK